MPDFSLSHLSKRGVVEEYAISNTEVADELSRTPFASHVVSRADRRWMESLIVDPPEVMTARQLCNLSHTQFSCSEQCNWQREMGCERLEKVKQTSLNFAAGNKLKRRCESDGRIDVERVELGQPPLAALRIQERQLKGPLSELDWPR